MIEPHGRSDHRTIRRDAARACRRRSRRASLPKSCCSSISWSPIEEVRATHRAALGAGAARPLRADRRPGRGDLPLFRPHRVPRAGRRRARSRPAAPRPWRDDYAGALASATAPRSAPTPTGSAGASPIHRTDRPASRSAARAACAASAPASDGTGVNRWHRGSHAERRMIAASRSPSPQPLVLLGAARACRCCGGCCGSFRRGRAASLSRRPALLFDIAPKEETPARTPWWLMLLR